tara:strand:+ start:382 stop:1143 length:762 start_codon:yes stop_codon:yes gene_type:complete
MINKIHNENCLDTMARMEDNFIDLTLTSPPYDNLRTYRGYSFDFESIAKELYRITKDGGVLVWVVGDATIKGSETGTSFKQALYFKEIGFNLHDTMIYDKGYAPNTQNNRYNNCFEYMFVFSKGKPKTYNLLREPRTTKGNRKSTIRLKNGDTKIEERSLNTDRVLRNIWHIDNGYNRTTKDIYAYKHPAMFPEQLANNHIISWTNERDLIFDCFIGSGTTAKMALKNNRDFIGSEISKEYCEIAEQRIKNEL